MDRVLNTYSGRAKLMSGKSAKIDGDKLDDMYRMIRRLENQNMKTGKRDDADMVKTIKQIINQVIKEGHHEV